MMFVVEEIDSPDGRCVAMLYMRNDGMYEGRIYCAEYTQRVSAHALHRTHYDSYFCGVADTLPRVRHIVQQELGLQAA